MKKFVLLITLFCFTCFNVFCQSVKTLDTEAFKNNMELFEGKEWKFLGDKPVILDLYADWCPPCKKLAPILEELQKQYGDKIQIYKINVDKEREIAQLFEASSIPLMIFIPAKGEPFKVVGLMPKAQLEKIINEKLLPSEK